MKKKPGRGRPNEGRVRLGAHVLPETKEQIEKQISGELNTIGKVLDAQFKPKRKKP